MSLVSIGNELQIRNLLANFVRLADESTSVDEVAMLFAREGRWSMATGQWEGRDAISAGLLALRNNGAGPGSRTRHILTNIAVQADDGSAATAHSCFLLISTEPPRPIVYSGQYIDELEKIDGIWLIKNRQVVVD